MRGREANNIQDEGQAGLDMQNIKKTAEKRGWQVRGGRDLLVEVGCDVGDGKSSRPLPESRREQ